MSEVSPPVLNVILCGEAVAEVDALIASIVTHAVVAVPEDNLMTLIHGTGAWDALTPGVVIGETYGKPPRLVLERDAVLQRFPGAGAALNAIAAQQGTGAMKVEGDVKEGSVVMHLYHAKDAALLLATSVKPHVLVVCFTPVIAGTFDRLNDTWLRTIDRLYPRPPLVLCGTRSEALAVRSTAQAMREHDVAAVDAEDIVDNALRWRCITYVEVSSAMNVNCSLLEDVILRACFGEPEKRLVPDAIMTMRQACVQAAVQRQSVWSARRNPKNNKLYYYNRLTKKAQWVRPRDYDGPEPELTREEKIIEEQRRLQEEELHMQQEREEADLDHYRRELEEFNQRIKEKSTRLQLLTTESNRLRSILDELRDRQQVNINERQALERRKEEIGLEEVHFSKTTVDVDHEIDAKIQIAKSKLFELEAVAALRAEDFFAAEISEALVVNRGLAATMRDLLRDEVVIQQQGSVAQSRYDATTKRIEHLSIELASLERPIQAAQAQLATLKAECSSRQQAERELRATRDELMREDLDVDAAALLRQEKAVGLRKQLDQLDAEVKQLRTTMEGQMRDNDSARESQRLLLLQETLLRDIAAVAASVAQCDHLLRQQKIHLTYFSQEFDRVSAGLLHLYQTDAEWSRRARDVLVEGPGYSPIAVTGLETVIEDAITAELGHIRDEHALRPWEARRSHLDDAVLAAAVSRRSNNELLASKRVLSAGDAAAAAAGRRAIIKRMSVEDKDVVRTMQNKIRAGHEADAAADRANRAAECLASVSQVVAHQRMELQEALEMVTEATNRYQAVPDNAGTTTLAPKTPWERLAAVVGPIVDDEQLWMRMLYEAFTSEVLKRVEGAGTTSDNDRARGGNSTAAAKLLKYHSAYAPTPLLTHNNATQPTSSLTMAVQSIRRADDSYRASRAAYEATARDLHTQMSAEASPDRRRLQHPISSKQRR